MMMANQWRRGAQAIYHATSVNRRRKKIERTAAEGRPRRSAFDDVPWNDKLIKLGFLKRPRRREANLNATSQFPSSAVSILSSEFRKQPLPPSPTKNILYHFLLALCCTAAGRTTGSASGTTRLAPLPSSLSSLRHFLSAVLSNKNRIRCSPPFPSGHPIKNHRIRTASISSTKLESIKKYLKTAFSFRPNSALRPHGSPEALPPFL
ncbi:hypothetical protein PIB30_052299 [Stylosanthes scabra]|uniref:Uncharacterized protein n=1 Tax=Stylosanthes scabra TaxID=79078 RepID=A0ABU6SI22_9FABA|nr:hypothetical protein [Stylosanthes scabra]